MARVQPIIFLALAATLFIAGVSGLWQSVTGLSENVTPLNGIISLSPLSPLPSPTPLPSPPILYIIPGRLHVFQTFNNCGPASLSMLLSYFNVTVSQQELGQKLRPFQHSKGDNDDKSVTLEELANEAQNYGLIAFHRPNGSIKLLKKFIASNLPVAVRTLTKPTEDIGHYRIIRGYDETTGEIVQDDSLQNKNLRFTFDYLNTIWQPFNYEYLVLVPSENDTLARAILGEEVDISISWTNALRRLEQELVFDPDNIYALFNLSIAHYYLKEYDTAINYFERVEYRLPFRMLWYQIEPIEAYFKIGNYNKVFQLTDMILNNHNRAFSELYLLRGEIYRRQGHLDLARSEFEKALLYHRFLKEATNALNSVRL